VLRVVRYLRAIQEEDGSWPQNCWLDGSPYWGGIQLDECAFPMLLLDMAWREGALPRPLLRAFWPMVARASGFVVGHGPRTNQDRWEENAGYTPFTLAVQIAALLAAAELAEACEVDDVADFLRDTADAWNEQIEDWIYVADTRLSRECGVPGYYVRIAPEVRGEARAALRGTVEVRNCFGEASHVEADELISTDALALVRFGLRAADDPRITDTVKVIDHVLRVDLPYGPGWRRYNGDGYGEHDDGRPYDGTGIGRVWPLLAGERAHYELAAGRRAEAERLLTALEAGASPGKLLPEQVWDMPAIPERELFPASRAARRCRWSGHMPSTSSCCARWRTMRCSTGRRRRCAAICGRSTRYGATRGVRTGDRHPSRWAACCGSTLPSRRWCIGARMVGRRAPTCRRATRA
jgi:glucoamylase